MPALDDSVSTLIALLITVLLVGCQFLAFWAYRTRRKTLAGCALLACMLTMVAAVVSQFPAQFVPATYERERIRESTFDAQVVLAAIECAVCFAWFVSLRQKISALRIACRVSLALVAAFVAALVFLMTAPAI